MKALIVCLSLYSIQLTAQENNGARLYGYVEPYFCYDFSKPSAHTRSSHIYSYNRHNEVSLNLGMLGATLSDSSYRINIAVMSGSYGAANMSNERPIFQHVFEANAGIRLSKRKAIWLDAGVMPSHIGFESAVGGNCPTLSRSVLADNTPYFETGVKLSYSADRKRWYFGFLVLNGWQRIEQRNGSSMLSMGTQITYTPNEKLTINSSTFVGTDEPDTTRKYRYFHNLYCIWNISERLQLTAGFDIGFQQVVKNSSDYDNWHSAVLISRYQLNTKFATALRAEYYHDPNRIIVSSFPSQVFSVYSYSANVDYQFNDHVKWRVEFRSFQSEAAIYNRNGTSVHDNFAICASIAVSI